MFHVHLPWAMMRDIITDRRALTTCIKFIFSALYAVQRTGQAIVGFAIIIFVPVRTPHAVSATTTSFLDSGIHCRKHLAYSTYCQLTDRISLLFLTV
jgi:hypothetical protein